MRIDPARTAVIISENDAEALAIVGMLRGENPEQFQGGVEVLAKPAGWGADVALDKADLCTLKDRDVVVLVEQPSATLERQLAARGKIVVHIDHHLYARADGQVLDRRNPRSSLEQVAEAFGIEELTPEQRLIAANDSGYIPALSLEAFRQHRDGLRSTIEAGLAAAGLRAGAIVSKTEAMALHTRIAREVSTPLRQQLDALCADIDSLRNREVAVARSLAAGGTADDADSRDGERLIAKIGNWLGKAGHPGRYRELACREMAVNASVLHLVLAPAAHRFGLGDAIYRDRRRSDLAPLYALEFDQLFETVGNDKA